MKKTIRTVVTALALTGTLAVNVQAEEVTVKKGDTLWGLAEAHQVSIEQLKEWNQLSTDLIVEGDEMIISPKELHTVKEGESLWGIAKKHNVTVDNIIQWNTLKTDVIHPNQVLEIYKNTNVKATAPKANPVAVQKPVTPVKSTTKVAANSAVTASKPVAKPVKVENTQVAGKELSVVATAYTASCEGCSGVTATGINLKENPNAKVISVDPNVIPLGSKVYVEGYGTAIAGDTGGSIKGNRIDIFIPTKEAALQWGKRTVKVTILQ